MFSIILQAGTQQNNPYAFPIMIASIFAIMYFLILRPQSKKQKEQQNLMNNLKNQFRQL